MPALFVRVVVLLGLLVTQACRAASGCQGCSRQFEACLARAQHIASAVQACQVDEEQFQEAQMRAALKRALGRLSAVRQQRLLDNQRQWERRRAENSRALVNEGLSGQKIASANAWLSSTVARTRELHEMQE